MTGRSILADLLRIEIELELLAARAHAAGGALGDPVLVAAGTALERTAASLELVAKRLGERGNVGGSFATVILESQHDRQT